MATWYISPTGDDTNGDGSQTNPWKTLNKAYSSAADGDTIILMDGIYDGESISSFSKDLTFKAQNAPKGLVWNAIMDAKSGPVVFKFGAPKSMTFDGIAFENVITQYWDFCFFLVYDLIAPPGTFTLNLLNCKFKDIAINVDRTTNEQGLIGVIRSTSDYILNLTIDKCLFVDLKEVGTVHQGHFALTKSSNGAGIWNIYNSTFHFKKIQKPIYELFYIQNNTTSINFKNCIINNTGGAINWGNSYANSYSIIVNSCINGINNVPSGTNVLNTDPKFIDQDNENYYLHPTSPCIDTGILV